MSAPPTTLLPSDEQFSKTLAQRNLRAMVWQRFFFLAIVVGMLALVALLANVINQSFGYIAVQYEVAPDTLTDGRALADLSADELAAIIANNQSESKSLVLIRDVVLGGSVEGKAFTETPIGKMLAGKSFPADAAELTIRDLTPEQVQSILAQNLGQAGLLDIVLTTIVGEQTMQTWSLSDSLFKRAEIERVAADEFPDAELVFHSWINLNFLIRPMSSTPFEAGIRTALLGSLWLIVITVLVAFPLGVGAAIYLEEYADHSFVSRVIETNIRNLAGVPSIIYGLLGLAIFVRMLESVTQGRTVLSAALTMALLILPVVIINAQEAIRAVPPSIREASYGLGATKWQTIWNTVLPAAVPGILTGTILAMSRAIGETAPLVVIGASTFIVFDPNGPFAKFTALPIQIYQWTARPQQEFRDIAAAAIVALLILLLSLNATAIILRQQFRRKLML